MGLFRLFLRYVSVGVLNTAIHWIAFYVIFLTAHTNQTLANFGAFCIAVTFSFFANARWTFESEATTIRYMIYVFFMGGLASVTGWVSDILDLHPVVMLITFSAISLVCGFFYSKLIVFRDAK